MRQILRNTEKRTITVGETLDEAVLIDLSTKAGAMLYLPADSRLERLQIFVAPDANGPYLPCGPSAEGRPGQAVPLPRRACGAPYVKLVGNVTTDIVVTTKS